MDRIDSNGKTIEIGPSFIHKHPKNAFTFFPTDFPHLPAIADVDNDLG